ncbi:MAG: DnaD domain protein [Lachnospiraceae bacterium]|nr:DnaD domain protein [Lachnospiraceae bacterium]
MYKIQITNNIQNSITFIPDYFIDRHLASASGEFVKVYLYIQRHLKETDSLTVPDIADHLNMTENDVSRALSYWKAEGVLVMEEEKTQPVTKPSIPTASTESAAALHVPGKSNLSPSVITARMEEEGLSHLAFMADTYLGKTLSQTELNTLFYFYDGLHFPVDLIEYLLEYCVSNQKKSMRYIETVAISWYEQGIDTMKKAKDAMKIYNKNYYSVMKAFGISNRNPGPAEANYIKKWLEEYHFDLPVILEACNRTLSSISQPSFPYTDTILSSWHKSKVHSLNDIKALDAQFRSQQKTATVPKNPNKNAAPAASNRFHNFDQREYNYQDLEQQFIRKVNGLDQS